ncbi:MULTISPECIES: hypothetical protein [Bacillaceae]|uniref:hypothetical protein n=2 Tax=Bacillales TaxID=1385 RepID=UPI00131A117B|nr:hypothetical protein [Bacillus kwashiorkori]
MMFLKKRDLILKIADKHGIGNVRVFGTVANFEDGPKSDLDLLVDIEKLGHPTGQYK